jgi:hypothetical protein
MSDANETPASPPTDEELAAKFKAGDLDALDILLTKWYALAAEVKAATEAEMTLRKLIFDNAFPTPKKGRNLKRISHGMALVGTYKVNFSIDRPGLETAREFIPLELFQTVIEYSPRVKESAFNDLGDNERPLFSDFITMKPGAPSIELKPQKSIRKWD